MNAPRVDVQRDRARLLVAITGLCILMLVPALLGWQRLASDSQPLVLRGTLIGLGLAGLGLLLAAMRHLRKTAQAPWLPISVGIGLATFGMLVAYILLTNERANQAAGLSSAAIAVREHLESRLESEARTIQRITRRWQAQGADPQQRLNVDIQAHLADDPGLVTVYWLDAHFATIGVFAHEEPAPEWMNNIPDNPRVRSALISARDSRQTTISRTFALTRGMPAFGIQAPLFVEGRFTGALVAVFSSREFLRLVLPELSRLDAEVIITDDRLRIFGPEIGKSRNRTHLSPEFLAEVRGSAWGVRVATRTEPGFHFSVLPTATFVVSLIMALLGALVVALAQTAAARARALETLNNELEHRVDARTGELRRALTDLERTNQDLEQFAYVASHDLQEPLRMISSYVQLLGRRYRGRLDADADEFIGYAVDGAERMKRLIHDLLAYSRLGTHGKSFQQVDTQQVVASAIANLEVAIGESGAMITADALPPVHGDPTQLLQVFQNLLANAIKFHGREKPRIHVSATRKGPEWTFVVRDNGIGIAPAYAERIFMLFRRLHTQQEYPGTGIGLTVCKRVIERHGGRIWVESEAGRGCAFHFTLPTDDGTRVSTRPLRLESEPDKG